ncbi:DUF3413 domain-containing protein [Thalassotalea sp. G2M2-11]|uniref:DUF3413 domain-containing protein n=1 Tax=Thalassotalea sp. G2M2-11 TaxID=2787627 RepID=UPI0019D2482C|nr:DUF3413 domain-containing protein [Thalassotalea sp. G2M2-11]
MVSADQKTYSKRLLQLVSWSHWFTFFNIIAAILLSSFYLFTESSPETFLGTVYLFTTWVSHMGFLTFIGFVLILFPLTLIYPQTRFIRGTASVVFTLGLLLLLLDAFIYSRLGYHLNASSSDQILALINTQIQQNNRAFWFISIVLFFSILMFQLVVSNYAWKHLRDLQKTVFAKFVVIGLVVSFFCSHIMHIWADANLEYDILKQDTVLPLSYPSTAKTLLTKYGLFDRSDYIARKTSPISFTESLGDLSQSTAQCQSAQNLTQSSYLLLTKHALSESQVARFSQRANANKLNLTKHIDNALPKDSWFNLLYSLPSVYENQILASGYQPLLFKTLDDNALPANFTLVGQPSADDGYQDYVNLFDNEQYLDDISSLVITNSLKNTQPGLHVFYFNGDDNYQFELFIDALLLSQRDKAVKDNIYISSIGNADRTTGLSIKPALLIAPNSKHSSVRYLTSQMDIQPTLVKNWLNCDVEIIKYSAGTDITRLNENRVIANTMDEGIMVFNKDKSVFIDQNGNFQSYSRQLEAPITVSSDFPLMIDGVNFIKRFAKHNQAEQ